jgi:hypothetical protein
VDPVQSNAVDRSPFGWDVCCFALWVLRASTWRLGTVKNERGLLVRVRGIFEARPASALPVKSHFRYVWSAALSQAKSENSR